MVAQVASKQHVEVVQQKQPHVYVRVSTLTQKRQGFSLPHQFNMCKDEAKRLGITEVPEYNLLHDADSGKNFHRKDLQELLTRAKQGKVSVVIFPKVDRMGRNARDSLNIVNTLHECGVQIVICDPNIDTSTPFGMFLFTMLAAMAALESEWIQERTGSGKLEKLEQYHDASRPASAGARSIPYGLEYIAPVKKGLDGEWKLNHEQHKWVLKIFEWTAMGKGGDTVASMLTQRSVPAPRGLYWWDITVRNIVKNTVYIGQMRRTMAGKEFIFSVPRSVPDELFHAANSMIAQNKRNSPRNMKHEYLLSSSREEPLLKCLTCHQEDMEHVMGGAFKPSNTPGGPDRLYYRCSNREKGIRKQHTVASTKIESAVWDYLVSMLKDPSLVLANIKKLSDASSRQYQDLQHELQGLSLKAAENKSAQARLVKLATLGRLSDDVIEAEAIALEREHTELEGRLSVLRVQLQQAQDSTLPITNIEHACSLLSEGADAADFHEKRWIIRTLVDVIYADKTGWSMEGKIPCLNSSSSVEGEKEGDITESRSSASFLNRVFLDITTTDLLFTISSFYANLSSSH